MRKFKAFLIILALFILFGGVFWFQKKGKGGEKQLTPTPTVAFPTISEGVEVSLTPKDKNQAVILEIKNIPEKIESVDYELSYITGKGLPRGVLGSIRLEEQEKEISREILLGTCSRNVCVYDEGVEKINLVLKFNSPEGSFQFQKEYEL